MVYTKIVSLVLLLLLLAPANFAFSQDDDKTEDEKVAELKSNAKELLRETTAMALTLGSPTNRINFTIQAADSLWVLDETGARAMFSASTEDIKRLMAQIDAETNQQEQARNTSWVRQGSSTKLRNKTSQVFSMCSSLVSSLANHDPEWAMRFVRETNGIFTNRKLSSRLERENKRLESTIIRKIAAKDVTKALELGREKLSKGVSSDVVSILSQIYGKDKEKGADFAKDVLSKLKSSTLRNSHTWIVIQLFQYGLSTANGDGTPLFDKSSMNSLGELIAKQIANSRSRYRSLSTTVMKGLEQYSPNSAAQVKRIFDQRESANGSRRGNRDPISKPGYSREKQKQMYEERSKFQNEISKNLDSLGNEELSDDDKKDIIEQTKNKILSVDNDEYRFRGLIGLAMRVAGIGDKETAANILNDAENYIKQYPKEQKDFSNSRTLADAYALVDADKSFLILESMIYRLNGVINGYIQFMEFSGNGRIVENDELIMNRRSRQFTGNLRLSPRSLRSLAESDFARLKDLTDKFERSEVRVEVRLLLAKSLLSAAQSNDNSEGKKSEKAIATAQNVENRLQQTEDEFQQIVELMQTEETK